MDINRAQIKQTARDIIRQSNPKVLYASAFFVALTALVSFLSTRLTGVSLDQLNNYMRYVQEGSFNYAMSALNEIRPSSTAQLISTALDVIQLIVSVGFTVFLFNTVRRTGAVYGNLLDGFGPYIRVVVLQIVVGVFIALWSLLFIIPGIVAAYRYSMAKYIMLDHPDYSIMQCIRASKQMTNGYKGKLFALDLSLLGYMLLSLIPYLGYLARVWFLPYRETSYILYYEKLRELFRPVDGFTVGY